MCQSHLLYQKLLAGTMNRDIHIGTVPHAYFSEVLMKHHFNNTKHIPLSWQSKGLLRCPVCFEMDW